ncbi:MAG: NAD(P)-dependent oxidoreductase [Myxococcales bacterium]
MITFLGTGLLGANFVRAALRRGESVTVYNRTRAKAEALAQLGARVADSPREAVTSAERVHIVLSDDAAVDEVLEAALPALSPQAVIIDHTTTSVTGTRARRERLTQRGVAFQHAPVFMGPQNALDATGVMLISGASERVEALRPVLEKMTGKLSYLGPDPERAAAFKLMGNLFLMFITAGLSDVLTLGKALGIPPQEAATLFDVFNPAVTLAPRLTRILGAEFHKPSWELAMARKDARLMLEEGVQGNSPLAMLPAIAEVMDRFIVRGHGKDDWTVIAKDALPGKTTGP